MAEAGRFSPINVFEAGEPFAVSVNVGSSWNMGKGICTLRINEIAACGGQ